jgi:hypothetical protein
MYTVFYVYSEEYRNWGENIRLLLVLLYYQLLCKPHGEADRIPYILSMGILIHNTIKYNIAGASFHFATVNCFNIIEFV